MTIFRRRRRGRTLLTPPTPSVNMGKGTLVSPDPPMGPLVAAVAVKQGGLKGIDYKPKYPYSSTSLERLAEGTPELIDFAMTIADDWDVSVIEVHRSPERQLELYNQGPHVTKVKFGKHNTTPSEAMDIAPYPIDWNDIDQFIRFTYFCKGVLSTKPYNLRNGADWDSDNDYADHSFLDWVHWEVV